MPFVPPKPIGQVYPAAPVDKADVRAWEDAAVVFMNTQEAARRRGLRDAGVQPLAHPAEVFEDVALRLRDDVVSESDRRAAYQAVAPSVENGLYLVPKVIE